MQPDDLAATTRALAEAVSNRAARVERGERAAQFVREHYSWASAAAAFTRLYDAVLDERSGSSRSGRIVRDRRRVGQDRAHPVVGQEVHDQLVVTDLGPQRVVRRHPTR